MVTLEDIVELKGNNYNSSDRKFFCELHNSLRTREDGQANKSARGMPWHQEPMKDVASCDKPRGGANNL